MPEQEHRLDYQRPHLYKKQFDAIFDPRRYSVIEASTKSGKTSGCIVWLIEKALAGQPGQNFWWVAPVSGQADIAFRRSIRALPREMMIANLTLKTITLLNGAVIWFKSADKPDSLYGDDVHAAVMDEASRTKVEAWHAVRSTLTSTQGPIRIIGNVKGRRNFFYQLARKAQAGDPVMGYHKLVAADAIKAGVLHDDEVEDARRVLPDLVFRELYLAEASDDEGNPFGMKAIEQCVAPLSDGQPRWWGWDLAKKRDWTVGIALDKQGKVCRFERFQKPWPDTLNTIERETKLTQALVDSTGVGDPIVDFLQKRSSTNYEGYLFTGPSKQKLMEGLAVAIQSSNISFPDGPIKLELEQFEYEYKRNHVHYCVDPTTPILTRDLRWVAADTLNIGDELVAFDENQNGGKAHSRRWRTSIVEQTARIVRPCYRIITDDGATLISSAEHRWLVMVGNKPTWRRTDELRPVHATSRSPRYSVSRLIRAADLWNDPSSYESGYLGAAFDGEGYISQGNRNDHHGTNARIGFSQRENAMSTAVRRYLATFGFSWSESKGGGTNKNVTSFYLRGRRKEFMRFLGQIRPKRLLEQFDPERLGAFDTLKAVPIKTIEYIGERTVIGLGTSTKTFIANGFASHNSAPEGSNDDCVCALALAVMCRGQADPKAYDISMDWVTGANR